MLTHYYFIFGASTKYNHMKRIFILIVFLQIITADAQVWPSESWSSATNLTGVMDAAGVTELSGLHFNPATNRLYCVQGNGRLRVLQFNTTTNTFSQIGNKSVAGGPEGITQADLNANEFYTVDENNYEIRRYTHTSNFSTVTLSRQWDLLAAPSPMENTGNTGPEGIAFVPDSFLTAAGFVSQQTGQLYTSVKGLGGLFFIAHQDRGYVWVFDINPDVNDDFAFVGKYQTNRSESCDLSFDSSTGLLYILHNVNNNRLEVTNLSSVSLSGNERKFVVTSEYTIATPTGNNDNIEGFALAPKCPVGGAVSAWLCRDVESSENAMLQQDVLRWFDPFAADGTCAPLATDNFTANQNVFVYPNPAKTLITISGIDNASVQVINSIGQVVFKMDGVNSTTDIDISALPNGIYMLEANDKKTTFRVKWIKG